MGTVNQNLGNGRPATGAPAFQKLALAQRFVFYLILAAIAIYALNWSFRVIREEEAPKLAVMLVALTVGIGGAWAVFWLADRLVAQIPIPKLREGLQPFIFVGPAILLLLVFLIYPTLYTTYISFFDARSELFVGLENYIFAFTEPDLQIAFRNNLLWLVVVTGVCVSLGLVIAVMLDRIRLESFAKALIFLPVAISSVGASVIWRFMYAFQPANRPQTGLLNAIVVALGGEPTGWFTVIPWNNFALIVIMIWLLTGFCMVVLSAAVKNVPRELLEAARIDGANEIQLFFRITIPYIRGSIITIATTVLIMVLKVFDIVYVMTRGNYDTEVIANRMYVEMYTFRNFGHGSALAVILFLAVLPAIVINIRNLRRQR
jgi:alpha-glucoside transport system permease protein